MNITFKISTKSTNSFILAVQKLSKLKSCEVISQDIQSLSLTISIRDICSKVQFKFYKAISAILDIQVYITSFSTAIHLDLNFNSFRNALCSLAKLNGISPGINSILLSNSPYVKAVPNKDKISLEVNLDISPIAVTAQEIHSIDFNSEYDSLIRSEIYSSISDISKLDEIQFKEALELSELLKIQRKEGGFTYRRFIISNLHLINDYSVIREALKLHLGNDKTLEKAVTVTRRILKELEEDSETIFYSTNSMIDDFLSSII